MVYDSVWQVFAPLCVIADAGVAVYKKRNLPNLQRWQIELYIKKSRKNFLTFSGLLYKKNFPEKMSAEKENIITYHIYAKDKCLYHNLKQDEFEETWELLNVMVGLLKTDYDAEDLSYEVAAPTVGVGGPVRIYAEPPGGDSY